MGQAGNSEANSSRVGMSGKENSARVEDYLGRLRRALAGLTSEQAADIVEELRSHILEKVAGQGEGNSAAIEDVLAALGSPEALAAEYMADDLLARAARRRSPFLLLRALLRWASLSAAGVFVFIGCAIGYFLGASFMLCAFLKPLHPQTAGLWRLADQSNSYSLRLGFGPAPPGGTELLGRWMLPLGLLLGGGLCFLTTQIALWFVQQFRRSGVPGRG
ncbi:MAG: DUF1700 domain-containing protein [Terriglobales bacterium]